MLKAVIVDDEVPVLNLLKMTLEKTGEVNVAEAFTNPVEALEGICRIQPDAVFLDIEMPMMNGLELASRIIEENDNIMIVFVTGYNQYALDAFRVNALDYILKPVVPNTIGKCITRLKKLRGIQGNREIDNSKSKIFCFGDFEVHANGSPVRWATRKVEEMLAYFIVYRNTSIDGWVLGEILWPEEYPDRVKANLHTTLYRLRKTIKEVGLPIEIISDKGGNGTYRCSFKGLSCDFFDFEDAVLRNFSVSKGSINKFEELCSLYKDDLFFKKNYMWCEDRKEWLRQIYIELLKEMAGFYMEEGLYQKAVNKLLRADAKAPFDEEIHRSLLKAYYKQKNAALMTKRHEEFKQRLEDEMGIRPQTETIELFLRLSAE